VRQGLDGHPLKVPFWNTPFRAPPPMPTLGAKVMPAATRAIAGKRYE
jgi:hypothetical protein